MKVVHMEEGRGCVKSAQLDMGRCIKLRVDIHKPQCCWFSVNTLDSINVVTLH